MYACICRKENLEDRCSLDVAFVEADVVIAKH